MKQELSRFLAEFGYGKYLIEPFGTLQQHIRLVWPRHGYFGLTVSRQNTKHTKRVRLGISIYYPLVKKNSYHFIIQSKVKPKPMVICTCTFFCTSCWLYVCVLSFDWFTALSVSFVIGQSDCFGFMALHQKSPLDKTSMGE